MEISQTIRPSWFTKIHRIVGVTGILAFLGTGLFMRIAKHGLEGLDPLPRMMFRSAHIYLLLASLINLALGLSPSHRQTKLQNIASILILIAPALMLTAFFVEPGLESFERPFAGPGIYALFAGMLLNFIAYIRS
jgi:uncharacterized protein involved in cysteine biosynthesis